MTKQVKPHSIRFYKGEWKYTYDGKNWNTTLKSAQSEEEAIKILTTRGYGFDLKAKDITVIKSKELIGKGHLYRIYRLASGNVQIEIRSKEYGDQYKTLPEKTTLKDAHIHARKAIELMSSAGVPELVSKKVLKNFTLNQLTNAYLGVMNYEPDPILGAKYPRPKDRKVSNRDRQFVEAFQKNEKQLCSRTLDQYHMIKKGFEDHIEKRRSEDITPYTITRNLSPIRTMYRLAGKRRLYGLIDYTVDLANPLSNLEFPEDKSNREEWYLKPEDEAKVFDAIREQCGKNLMHRLRWITLVTLALTTALRRGVLLQLKWKDIDWEHKVINITKDYWKGGKVAPPMVPLPQRLAEVLKRYYNLMPEKDRGPNIELFENSSKRILRHRQVYSSSGTPLNKIKASTTGWADFTWNRIIRRTDLFKETVNSEGETEQEWFHFHDLRRTATHRYADVDTYNMGTKDYSYLLGHTEESKMTKKYNPKHYYDICRRIRTVIDKGDELIAEQLKGTVTEHVFENGKARVIHSGKSRPDDAVFRRTLREMLKPIKVMAGE